MCNKNEIAQKVDTRYSCQYPIVYAAKSKSSQVLKNSSSGGLFLSLIHI